MVRVIFIVVLVLLMNKVFTQDYKGVHEAKGLEVGRKAPMFKAVDADGIEYSLSKALESGPVVMIFFRGQWCPVCNRHLGQIQDSLRFIYETGATVVAISPEKPEYLEMTKNKTGAEFTILYDEGYRIANAYDVTFLPEQRLIFKYNTFLDAKLKESHSDDSQRLPIPATYIVNQEGIIVWRQFDPNYRNRSSVTDIVKVFSE